MNEPNRHGNKTHVDHTFEFVGYRDRNVGTAEIVIERYLRDVELGHDRLRQSGQRLNAIFCPHPIVLRRTAQIIDPKFHTTPSSFNLLSSAAFC